MWSIILGEGNREIYMTDNFREKLGSGCGELEVNIDEEALDKLYRYYTMVVEKNKVMNLTAITEEDEFIVKHLIDSLSIAKSKAFKTIISGKKAPSLIDVGTGAGFPGMVLKIAYPDLKIVLFDSLKKRLNFLDEVIEELGLTNIHTLHGRAEDCGHDKKYREGFDLAVSRAVANMSSLSEYCLPFVKKDGYFIAYKSGESSEELGEAKHAIRILGGSIEEENKLVLPASEIERSLIAVKKVKNTPSQYPRKAGTPTKEPIR